MIHVIRMSNHSEHIILNETGYVNFKHNNLHTLKEDFSYQVSPGNDRLMKRRCRPGPNAKDQCTPFYLCLSRYMCNHYTICLYALPLLLSPPRSEISKLFSKSSASCCCAPHSSRSSKHRSANPPNRRILRSIDPLRGWYCSLALRRDPMMMAPTAMAAAQAAAINIQNPREPGFLRNDF